jgi:hypothetical protein
MRRKDGFHIEQQSKDGSPKIENIIYGRRDVLLGDRNIYKKEGNNIRCGKTTRKIISLHINYDSTRLETVS